MVFPFFGIYFSNYLSIFFSTSQFYESSQLLLYFVIDHRLFFTHVVFHTIYVIHHNIHNFEYQNIILIDLIFLLFKYFIFANLLDKRSNRGLEYFNKGNSVI